MEWSVPKRTGKIFMDYNMNVRGKTLNVAYSPRGAPGAPVSMPLTWEELAKAHPLDFRITNAVAAPGKDRRPLAAMRSSRKQSLETGARARQGLSKSHYDLLQRIQTGGAAWLHVRSRRLTVSFGLVSIPVKLYLGHRGEPGDLLQPAAQDLRLAPEAAVHLHQGRRRRSRARTWSRATSSPRTST